MEVMKLMNSWESIDFLKLDLIRPKYAEIWIHMLVRVTDQAKLSWSCFVMLIPRPISPNPRASRVTFLSHLPEHVAEVVDWSGRAELHTENSLDRVVCREVDCDPLAWPLLLLTGIQTGAILHITIYSLSNAVISLKVTMYSETWELGPHKGLPKIVLNSKVVLFLRFISMYWIDLGTEVGVLNSQVVPISQVVFRTGFTVLKMQPSPCVSSSLLLLS